MQCVLVRHAIAANRDAAAWPDDSKRPLTPKGVERFRRAARGLGRLVQTVDVVLASPYTRAWDTAAILREEAGWPAPEPCAELEADQHPRAVVNVLRDRAGVGSIALVGHEPHLSSLASLLLAGDESAVRLELKKGGAMLLALDRDRPGVLHWHLTPRILRGLGDSR